MLPETFGSISVPNGNIILPLTKCLDCRFERLVLQVATAIDVEIFPDIFYVDNLRIKS